MGAPRASETAEPLYRCCVHVTEGTAVSGVFLLIGSYLLKAWSYSVHIILVSNSQTAEGELLAGGVESHKIDSYRHPDQPAYGLLAAGGLLFRCVFTPCALAMPDDLWFGMLVCQGTFLWVIREGNNLMTTFFLNTL